MTTNLDNNLSTLKVLIIAPYQVYPANTGGRIRVFELAKGLAERNLQVTIISPMSPAQLSQKMINKNLLLEVIPYPFMLPFLFTDKPFSYLFLISLHPGFHVFLKKYFATYDIFQFEGVSFADLIDFIPPGKKIIYDAHNVEYDYVTSENRRPWVAKISTNRTYKFEQRLASRANRILTCSATDSERLAQLYKIQNNKLLVIENGIDPQKQTPRLTLTEIKQKFPTLMDFPQRAIFSGSDVVHNRAAVEFIIETLAPQLKQQCAFIIKGQCGNNFNATQGPNIFFDPQPENVGPYADLCTVALNPVTQGSGTSLKVLDYLAHGLPVISTEFGMRGFDDLKPYIVLSDTQNFTQILLQKHKFNPNILSAIEKYSWQSISQRLFDNYALLSQK